MHVLSVFHGAVHGCVCTAHTPSSQASYSRSDLRRSIRTSVPSLPSRLLTWRKMQNPKMMVNSWMERKRKHETKHKKIILNHDGKAIRGKHKYEEH